MALGMEKTQVTRRIKRLEPETKRQIRTPLPRLLYVNPSTLDVEYIAELLYDRDLELDPSVNLRDLAVVDLLPGGQVNITSDKDRHRVQIIGSKTETAKRSYELVDVLGKARARKIEEGEIEVATRYDAELVDVLYNVAQRLRDPEGKLETFRQLVQNRPLARDVYQDLSNAKGVPSPVGPIYSAQERKKMLEKDNPVQQVMLNEKDVDRLQGLALRARGIYKRVNVLVKELSEAEHVPNFMKYPSWLGRSGMHQLQVIANYCPPQGNYGDCKTEGLILRTVGDVAEKLIQYVKRDRPEI